MQCEMLLSYYCKSDLFHVLLCLNVKLIVFSSDSLVVTKSHVCCYQLGGAGKDCIGILLGLNFSDIAGGVSHHA